MVFYQLLLRRNLRTGNAHILRIRDRKIVTNAHATAANTLMER